MIHHSGRIEVICGSMFCGKTEELIRRVRRAVIAKQTVQVFKPIIDDRYGIERVTSHDGQNIEAQPIANAGEIPALLSPKTTVVAIDEAQFFDDAIVPIVEDLAARGIRVICAGLDLDFRGEPFGPMPQLLARAEEVTKLHAICVDLRRAGQPHAAPRQRQPRPLRRPDHHDRREGSLRSALPRTSRSPALTAR